MLLEEFTKEQEAHNKSMNELVSTVKLLSDKFILLEEKVNDRQPIYVNTDTTALESIVKHGITNMQSIASTKPQPVVKKWQILLFPERDTKLFYKIVFGRWFLWLVMIFALACLYRFGINWSDNRQRIITEQLENEKIRKAWIALYEQENKTGRRRMDDAYGKVK